MQIDAYLSISEGKAMSHRIRVNLPVRLQLVSDLPGKSSASAISSMLHKIEVYRRELALANPTLSIITIINHVDVSIQSELPF